MANAEPRPGAMLAITVAFSPRSGEVDLSELSLPPGSTAADALAASGLLARHPEIDLREASLGVWGASCDAGQPLRDRDRVEVYRPLLVDPKDARRRRQQQQRELAAAARKARRR